MGSTTFFGNRARASVLDTKTAAGAVTLTNNSTAYTCTGAVVGDYVWGTAAGQQFAAKVLTQGAPGVLAYVYKGPNVAAAAGYYSTPTPFQVLRGLEVTTGYEVRELYGTDSIVRQDEAKYQVKISHTTKYCKWNPDPAVDWTMKILRPSGGTGVIDDTNTVYLNGVVYYITASDAGILELVMGDVYYEGLPYPFPENDFMIRELKGNARSAILNSY